MLITVSILFTGCSRSEKDVYGTWNCKAGGVIESKFKFNSDHTGAEYFGSSPIALSWSLQDNGKIKISYLDPRVAKEGAYTLWNLNLTGDKLTAESGNVCTKSRD
jgi:hypothetical protein